MAGSKSEKEKKKYQIKAENDFDYTYGGKKIWKKNKKVPDYCKKSFCLYIWRELKLN